MIWPLIWEGVVVVRVHLVSRKRGVNRVVVSDFKRIFVVQEFHFLLRLLWPERFALYTGRCPHGAFLVCHVDVRDFFV